MPIINTFILGLCTTYEKHDDDENYYIFHMTSFYCNQNFSARSTIDSTSVFFPWYNITTLYLRSTRSSFC